MRGEIECLRQRVRRSINTTSINLQDEQNEEMIKLVKCVSDSDVSLSELERIYEDAEVLGEGRGVALKETWESDVECFFSDQRRNGMSY